MINIKYKQKKGGIMFMKKIAKTLAIMFCAMVVAVSSMLLSACSGGAYNIAGVTLSGNGELKCIIVWSEDTTPELKEQILSNMSCQTEQDLIDYYVSRLDDVIPLIKLEFQNDGTLLYTDGKFEDRVYYYEQSTDLKIVELYSNAEHTSDVDGMRVEFIDGKTYLRVMTTGVFSTYFLLYKV